MENFQSIKMSVKMRHVLILIILISACKSNHDSDKTEYFHSENEYPIEISNMFDAHGGIDHWKQKGSLSFHFDSGDRKELHTIDLKNRKVLINGDGYDIGYNREHVWISPDRTNFSDSDPGFYHSLYFYFQCLVFLVGDKGVNYQVLGEDFFDGDTLLAISVTYEKGIGDSPDDEYVLYLDPLTHRLKKIKYTVTYYSHTSSDQYNGVEYNNWTEVDGLLLPTMLKWYSIEGQRFSAERLTARFSDIRISDEVPEPMIFEVPEIAEIDNFSK